MAKITDIIVGKLSDYKIEYRIHASQRMFQRDIHEDDVEAVLERGNIIEKYDQDFPLPSVLINGRNSENRHLHVVVGVNVPEQKLVIITAYDPDRIKWIKDFSRRSQ